MSGINAEIGARIRGVRELSDLSRAEFARRSATTAEKIAMYEEGTAEIPVSILHDIAAAFNMDITELLTGEAAKLKRYSVVRAGRGVGIERRREYDYKSLAYKFAGRKIDPYLITVEPRPEGDPVPTTAHSGHEFHYVLSGCVRVVVGKYETQLTEGDSIYFDSTHAHGIQAIGGSAARLLVSITGHD